MQYELWKRMVLLDMLSIRCSRLQSKPDYSTVPQLGQVTVLLPTATVWNRFCKRLDYCDVDTQSVVEQFQLADETLFERVLNDGRHVLHSLLPSRTEYSYNLRRRRHDYELIAKTRTLDTNNFIIRMLYKDSYWHLHTLSIRPTYHYFIKRILYCIVWHKIKLYVRQSSSSLPSGQSLLLLHHFDRLIHVWPSLHLKSPGRQFTSLVTSNTSASYRVSDNNQYQHGYLSGTIG